jgi:uncharacterized protein YbjQ (UPF0145 family)
MKIIFGIALFLVFTSCATEDLNRPAVAVGNLVGNSKDSPFVNAPIGLNSLIAIKDYEALGIIFAKSTKVEAGSNKTGSEITYEMLMSEVQKLGADDVINVKIDVHKKSTWMRTEYNYTASALAIKYTTALPIENIVSYTQNIENHDIEFNKTTTSPGWSSERPSSGNNRPSSEEDGGDSRYEPVSNPGANFYNQVPPSSVNVTVYASAPIPVPQQYPDSPLGVRLIPPLNPQPDKTYKLQVGAYRITQNAANTSARLTEAGLSPSYEKFGDLCRVLLAGVSGVDIRSVTDKIKMAGFDEVIIREEP